MNGHTFGGRSPTSLRLSEARPAASALDNTIFVACGLAWGAGLIHLQAAVDHAQEYALYAAFFGLLATAQFAWGLALYRRRSRRLLRLGAIASMTVVALWAVSRTLGLPIAPVPWVPEPVGALDSIATADEIVLALLVFASLRVGAAGMLMRGSRYLGAALGLGLIMLSSLVFVFAGGHAH